MDIFTNLEPHCAMIVGRRGCGKSVYAIQLLETVFKKHFDSVVIICPTFEINAAYNRDWINNKQDRNVHIVPKQVFDRCDLNTILLHLSKQFECCGQTLFLIDDCAFLGGVRHKETALNQLAFTSRHAGISIWVITQKYNAVSKDFREQLSWIALFYCKDKDSFLIANDENSVLTADERIEAANFLKDVPHGKLLIRTDLPVEYKLLN